MKILFKQFFNHRQKFRKRFLQKVSALLILGFSLSGCIRSYYPAVAGTRSSAMYFLPPQNYKKHVTFLGVEGGTGAVNHSNEINMYGRVNYGRAFAEKFYNFNISLFGYGGFYKVAGMPVGYNGYKNFLGFGPQVKLGFHINFWEYVKLGVGLTFTGGIEFGEFYNFRNKAQNEGLISSNTNLLFAYPSIYPYLLFKVSQNSSIALQPVIGFPGFISPNIIYNYGSKSFWVSFLPFSRYDYYPLGSFVAGFYWPLN